LKSTQKSAAVFAIRRANYTHRRKGVFNAPNNTTPASVYPSRKSTFWGYSNGSFSTQSLSWNLKSRCIELVRNRTDEAFIRVLMFR